MKVKLCRQVKFDTTYSNNMFVNNVTCLKQQQPLAIHYDRVHNHSIVVLVEYIGTLGNVGRATCKNNIFDLYWI